MVVLYSARPDIANFSLSFRPYNVEILKTSVACLKPFWSSGSSLSSNFTQLRFRVKAFLQKYLLSFLLAKPLTVKPIVPAELFGDSWAYQLLNPEKLPPIVPKAPTFQPGKAGYLTMGQAWCVTKQRFNLLSHTRRWNHRKRLGCSDGQ